MATVTLTLRVLNVNDDPVITTDDIVIATEDIPYQNEYEGFDIDPTNDKLEWKLKTDALFLSLDAGTGALSGMPTNDDVGEWWVNVSVSDGNGGLDWTNFTLTVVNVNDPPSITLPSSCSIDEGTELWLTIEAEDEDNEEILYFVDSTFHGFELHPNGTLRVWAAKGEVGDYFATVSVMDVLGAGAIVTLQLEVRNVNDPPEVPVILAPINGLVLESGAVIEFDVQVGDPDTRFGQVLSVTWVSDLEGELEQRRSDQAMGFQRSLDLPGTHWVVVTVDDGEYHRSAWIVVKVREPRPEGSAEGQWHAWLAVAVVALVVSLYVVYRIRMKGEA